MRLNHRRHATGQLDSVWWCSVWGLCLLRRLFPCCRVDSGCSCLRSWWFSWNVVVLGILWWFCPPRSAVGHEASSARGCAWSGTADSSAANPKESKSSSLSPLRDWTKSRCSSSFQSYWLLSPPRLPCAISWSNWPSLLTSITNLMLSCEGSSHPKIKNNLKTRPLSSRSKEIWQYNINDWTRKQAFYC